HGNAGPRAADVGRALDQADAAVMVDAGGAARLEAAVEPEAGRDPTAAVGAAELRLVMRMVSRRLGRLDHADLGVDRSIGAARAFMGRVLDAEIERVDLQLLADFIDHRFG